MAKKEEVKVLSRADILRGHGRFTPSFVSSCSSDDIGVLNAKEVDVFFEKDPFTDLPRGDLSRVIDPSLTHSEREAIMSRLQKMPGNFLPSELSDEDIYNLVPPRYFVNDAVDVQHWRDYLGNTVFKDMDVKTLSVAQNLTEEGAEANDNNNEE